TPHLDSGAGNRLAILAKYAAGDDHLFGARACIGDRFGVVRTDRVVPGSGVNRHRDAGQPCDHEMSALERYRVSSHGFLLTLLLLEAPCIRKAPISTGNDTRLQLTGDRLLSVAPWTNMPWKSQRQFTIWARVLRGARGQRHFVITFKGADMKLLYFNDFRLGVLKGDTVVDVTSVVQKIPHTGPGDLMNG